MSAESNASSTSTITLHCILVASSDTCKLNFNYLRLTDEIVVAFTVHRASIVSSVCATLVIFCSSLTDKPEAMPTTLCNRCHSELKVDDEPAILVTNENFRNMYMPSDTELSHTQSLIQDTDRNLGRYDEEIDRLSETLATLKRHRDGLQHSRDRANCQWKSSGRYFHGAVLLVFWST
ncbi:hypothetical protein D9758_013302 [Tetrapyrgos nigripes]|uniref:Uncharacterized protein n=1 Tax=Tetrapyrgos nigripes TaxID=182062 RepID=A0A8H5FJT8_9AGAR|nr:hypothetical protein D9758_013302 [Tetrapyrgos nigripes]